MTTVVKMGKIVWWEKEIRELKDEDCNLECQNFIHYYKFEECISVTSQFWYKILASKSMRLVMSTQKKVAHLIVFWKNRRLYFIFSIVFIEKWKKNTGWLVKFWGRKIERVNTYRFEMQMQMQVIGRSFWWVSF
jgi:hypothetical protein